MILIIILPTFSFTALNSEAVLHLSFKVNIYTDLKTVFYQAFYP